MKKLILCTALIAISLQGKLFAQTDNEDESYLSRFNKMSKASQTFDTKFLINIRDFVSLREGRLILELSDVGDYESFKNLDSILLDLRKDIAFYKDSLNANPTGNLRIDYALSPGYGIKMRFKRYNPDGSMFLSQKGDLSRLKFEQDTVRIVIKKSKPGLGSKKTGGCMIAYSIQATFLLDNYYDIDKVIADNVLRGIIDTLEKASQVKRYKKDIYSAQFSIIYNPYYSGGSLKVVDRLMKDEYDQSSPRKSKSRFLSVNAMLGAGFVRNVAVPMADIGIQYNKYWSQNHNLFRLSATPYFFWGRTADGGYAMQDNWFVNGEIGSIYHRDAGGWFGKECTFGLGYLALQKGGYFKNTTMKVFTSLQIISWITIVPEIICTDNFKQIFPGFTVKVF